MIRFSSQNDFRLAHSESLVKWIEDVVIRHGKVVGEIDYVFCSDEFLLKINQEYLSHDTYTDIITFDYSMADELAAEIYISSDRVADNAERYGVTVNDELHRVIIHGILHLSGYRDASDEDKQRMRELEDEALLMRSDGLLETNRL
jgi:rRNA maturation RNase YbeY